MMKEPGRAMKRPGVKDAYPAAEQPKQRVVQQLHRVVKANLRLIAEDRRPTSPGTINGIANNGGDEGRDNCINFQVLRIQDFGTDQRAAQGGAKDRANARANARRQRNAPVSHRQTQPASQQRTKSGRDLSSWPLAASAAAGPNRDSRSHQLN